MDTDNIILQLPGSMEGITATSADVQTYVETPSPTPDNVPTGLVYTMAPQNTAPKNAVDEWLATIESIYTSAVSWGVIRPPTTGGPAPVVPAPTPTQSVSPLLIAALAVGGIYLATR